MEKTWGDWGCRFRRRSAMRLNETVGSVGFAKVFATSRLQPSVGTSSSFLAAERFATPDGLPDPWRLCFDDCASTRQDNRNREMARETNRKTSANPADRHRSHVPAGDQPVAGKQLPIFANLQPLLHPFGAKIRCLPRILERGWSHSPLPSLSAGRTRSSVIETDSRPRHAACY